MTVEGLHRLADELAGSTNPPFKVFGERMREELGGVVDASAVAEAPGSSTDTPPTSAETQEAEEAPLPEEEASSGYPAEEGLGAGDTPDEQPSEEPESGSPAEETQDQYNARVHGMDPH